MRDNTLPQVLLKHLRDILSLHRKAIKWTTGAGDDSVTARSIGRPYITIQIQLFYNTQTLYLRIKHKPVPKPPSFEPTDTTDANYDLNDPKSLNKMEQLINKTIWEHDT